MEFSKGWLCYFLARIAPDPDNYRDYQGAPAGIANKSYCPIITHFVFSQVSDSLFLNLQQAHSVAPLMPH
jgi:hypothetical protein